MAQQGAPLIIPRLRKATGVLAAAEACCEAGLWDSAVSRAYYAAFHAAVAYLRDKAGTSAGRGGRWSHQYVGQAFYRCAKAEGELLNDLYQARTVADYTTAAQSAHDARRAIEMSKKIYGFCVKALTPDAGTSMPEGLPSKTEGSGT